jgi:hypothetical protein
VIGADADFLDPTKRDRGGFRLGKHRTMPVNHGHVDEVGSFLLFVYALFTDGSSLNWLVGLCTGVKMHIVFRCYKLHTKHWHMGLCST